MSTNDVNRWEDSDPHLLAYRRIQEEKEMRAQMPRVISREDLDAPVRRGSDQAEAIIRSLTQTVEPGAWAMAAEEAHTAYEERRRQAQQLVRMADRLGEPVDPEIRRLAETESAHVQIQQMLEKRAEDRAAALREARKATAAPLPVDPSLLRHMTDDPWGRALEAQHMFASCPQIQAHRQMAERKPEPAVRSEPQPEKRGLFGRRK
jgi:hypothetical protein